MRSRRVLACVVITVVSELAIFGEQFATFPERKELPSPDGQYVIRNVDWNQPAQQFSGMFHSLFLEERATGTSRKLCDCVRRVAVAWSGGNRIILTDYLNPKTSRALVFAFDGNIEPIVIDKVNLQALIPPAQGLHLSRNDHVFVEASSIAGSALLFRVWGYGSQDINGFRMKCSYDLTGYTASCEEVVSESMPPR
jgi:hypothetical protein